MPAGKVDLEWEGEKDHYFEAFIRLADENEIPTVFFFMPVYAPRVQKMKALGWLAYIGKQLKGQEHQYRHFMFYDRDPLGYKRKYFGDYSHLNQRGAEKFNREFTESLKEILKEIEDL